MKEGRRGGKGKIETKNLYLSKQMERRQRGTFLSITRDIDMAPLHSFSLKENKPMTLKQRDGRDGREACRSA